MIDLKYKTIKMTIKEYQLEANRTCSDLGNRDLNYLHIKMGIFTEIGEIVDIFKKNLAYKKEIDLINLGEEIVDVAWYIVNWDTFNKLSSSIDEHLSKNESLYDVIVSLDYIYDFYSDAGIKNDVFNTSQQLGILKTIAEYYNLNFYELLDRNIAKLKARFPEKFTEEAALNRDLIKERKILEGKHE